MRQKSKVYGECVVPENIHTAPQQKGLEIPGRVGGFKGPIFKAMYEAKLEFPEGVGQRANPFRGGGGGI